MYPEQVVIKEVGPRDGLQNESTFIDTEDKIKWINCLSKSGLKHIEVTSFVHPKWIPQLKDAVEVTNNIDRNPNVTYTALVPNAKGLERALEADIDEVAIFMSASESHNKKNINKSITDTFPVLQEVAKEAIAAGKPVRGYISTVFGCPYEGAVDVDQVVKVATHLYDMGVEEVSFGDTIGVANPKQVKEVIATLSDYFPKKKMAMHFHDTYGMAMANVLASLEMGITIFDGALGGLGGCPYAPGARGNIATDDLIHMLAEMGIETGINKEKLHEAAKFIQEKIGRDLRSSQMQTRSS